MFRWCCHWWMQTLNWCISRSDGTWDWNYVSPQNSDTSLVLQSASCFGLNYELFLWFCHMAVFNCLTPVRSHVEIAFQHRKGWTKSTLRCINKGGSIPLGRVNSTHHAANWERVFMAHRVGWKGDIGTCYWDSDGCHLLPDLEFNLTIVSTQRLNEFKFDVDGESEMTCGQKVHMPKYYFHQIP